MSNSFNPQAGFPQNRKDRRLHHHRFGQHRRQCGLCRDFQRQPERGRRTRTRRLLRAGVSKGRTNAYADTDSYANTHADGYSNSDSYTYGNAYGHTDGDCYCYSPTDTDAEDHADPERASDSAAETQSLIPE